MGLRSACMVFKELSADEKTRLEAEQREKGWRDEMDRLYGAKEEGILHAEDAPLASRRSLWRFALGEADRAVADALPVALDAKLSQHGLALRTVELLLGAVYPAAAEPKGVGCQHEVAHDKAAVVDAGGLRSV